MTTAPIRQTIEQMRRDFPYWRVRYERGRWRADVPHYGRIDESNAPALRLRLDTIQQAHRQYP